MKQYKVACALVRNPQGELLMVRQPPMGQQKEEYWILPGGKMERLDQDCYLTAACREVMEETGLKLTADMGKFIYSCEYENFGDDSSVLVNMHIFHADGALLPADPDRDILEAKFIPHDEAVERIKSLPWPAVRAPLLAYLADPEKKQNLHWRYRAVSKDKHELIDISEIPSGRPSPSHPKQS